MEIGSNNLKISEFEISYVNQGMHALATMKIPSTRLHGT